MESSKSPSHSSTALLSGAGGSCATAAWPATASGRRWLWRRTTSCAWPSSCPRHHLRGRSLPVADDMPQPEAPAARSGAIQGAAYSESACNGTSMPTPARSLYPKRAFFISLLCRLGAARTTVSTIEPRGTHSYLEVEETWQHHRCHQYCGLKGQSTILTWPLTCPPNGVHLSYGTMSQYCCVWE